MSIKSKTLFLAFWLTFCSALQAGVKWEWCKGFFAGGWDGVCSLNCAAPAIVGDYFARDYLEIYNIQTSELDRCTSLAIEHGRRRAETCQNSYVRNSQDWRECLILAREQTQTEIHECGNENYKIHCPLIKTAYN